LNVKHCMKARRYVSFNPSGVNEFVKYTMWGPVYRHRDTIQYVTLLASALRLRKIHPKAQYTGSKENK
jgi:hypothetical protein